MDASEVDGDVELNDSGGKNGGGFKTLIVFEVCTQDQSYDSGACGMAVIEKLREEIGEPASHIICVNESRRMGPTLKANLRAEFITIVAIPKDALGKTIFFNENRSDEFKKMIIDQLTESGKTNLLLGHRFNLVES